MKNNSDIKIMPYCEIDGIRTFRDSEILEFYDRMVKARLAETVFSDGQIDNREDWLRAMKNPENFLYAVYVGKDVVFLVWLNRVEIRKAQFHYCGFFKGWRIGSVKIGKQFLNILMNKRDSSGNYLFDVLTGLTPSSNKPAIEYMQECGWKIIGELPLGAWNNKKQKSESAVMSYFTREVQSEDI